MTAWSFWIPLLAPVLFFHLLISMLFKESPFNRFWIALPIAAGLGIGCSSWLYGVVLLLSGPPGIGYFYFELPALLGLSGIMLFLLSKRRRSNDPMNPDHSAMGATAGEKATLCTFLLFAAAAAVFFFLASLKTPHGGWDAWAVWNLKARFVFRGGEAWTNVFSPSSTGRIPIIPCSCLEPWPAFGPGREPRFSGCPSSSHSCSRSPPSCC